MDNLTARVDAIIETLQAAREDAEKCDKGKTGAPGTRLRTAAAKASSDLKSLRAAVLESRKS